MASNDNCTASSDVRTSQLCCDVHPYVHTMYGRLSMKESKWSIFVVPNFTYIYDFIPRHILHFILSTKIRHWEVFFRPVCIVSSSPHQLKLFKFLSWEIVWWAIHLGSLLPSAWILLFSEDIPIAPTAMNFNSSVITDLWSRVFIAENYRLNRSLLLYFPTHRGDRTNFIQNV